MIVKTGLRSGVDEASQQAAEPAGLELYPGSKWRTCYRCRGTRDKYGNLTNAACQLCWPMNMQPPV